MKIYLLIESVKHEGDNFIAAYINELDANNSAARLNTDEQASHMIKYYVEPVDVIM